MDKTLQFMKFSLDIKRSEQLANICGSLDKNLENIASNLNVTISNKGADFNIITIARINGCDVLLECINHGDDVCIGFF